MGVVYHPSPLDARAIGALVSQYEVTFLLASPTFLHTYVRCCSAEDFGSLQYVMAGAEKLPERVAQAFEDYFGVRPLEGYGCTECSPAVTVNTRDFRAAQFRQVGAKRASIGHPLPGISVRVVDPVSIAPLAPGENGLLLVRGPNVMQGYLGRPEKTAEVLHDGWYNTGDIAAIDEDGFIHITDRLSRFSKIGGEMVPHIKVEDKLQEIAGATEQLFAVTAIPDDKKWERLIDGEPDSAFGHHVDIAGEEIGLERSGVLDELQDDALEGGLGAAVHQPALAPAFDAGNGRAFAHASAAAPQQVFVKLAAPDAVADDVVKRNSDLAASHAADAKAGDRLECPPVLVVLQVEAKLLDDLRRNPAGAHFVARETSPVYEGDIQAGVPQLPGTARSRGAAADDQHVARAH